MVILGLWESTLPVRIRLPPLVGYYCNNFLIYLESGMTKDILTEYSKILVFLSVALFLALALVFLNWVLVKKSQSFNKTSIYECGFDNFNSAKEKFTVHFYIIAILFVIFDIEIIFLYAMSYSITITKFFGIFILFSFLIILILGLIFEWNNGVLDWNKKTFNSFFLSFFLTQDFFINDFIIFIVILFFFLILNFLLIFNRTISNLLSLIFFLMLGCIFLLISFKAEFLVYSYLLVYVGGISVLFLFGLMSVNQKMEYRRFGLINFNKLLINLFSCILSFFVYNLVIQAKSIHDLFSYNSFLNDSRNLDDPFFLSNSTDSRVFNNSGYLHDLASSYVIDSEIDAVAEFLFLGTNPYILLFSMFFLLIALIVSIELCLVNKKID